MRDEALIPVLPLEKDSKFSCIIPTSTEHIKELELTAEEVLSMSKEEFIHDAWKCSVIMEILHAKAYTEPDL